MSNEILIKKLEAIETRLAINEKLLNQILNDLYDEDEAEEENPSEPGSDLEITKFSDVESKFPDVFNVGETPTDLNLLFTLDHVTAEFGHNAR